MSHPRTVAIAGFGTVGRAVARALTSGSHPSLQLTHILNRNVARKKVDWVPPSVHWTDDFGEVLASGVEIVVELIGGLEPAEEWVRRSLEAGKAVVTANKQVIAHRGPELAAIASHHRTALRFEAAVAGGIPVVRAIQDGLAGDRLTRVVGILNGTCNYILSRMAESTLAFGDALNEARALGYAEADPGDDLDGVDARAKLTILASVGLHRRLASADIPSRSIAGVDTADFEWARRLKSTIRQLSWAEIEPGEESREESRVTAWVAPSLVADDSVFASVQRNQNLVVTRGERSGETSFRGLGAGGDATAVAVLSDLLTVARERGSIGEPVVLPHAVEPVRRDFVAPHYVRLHVREGMDAFRKVLSQHAIHVDRVLREPVAPDRVAVVTLAPCQWRVIDHALAEAAGMGLIEGPMVLPIVDLKRTESIARAEASTR